MVLCWLVLSSAPGSGRNLCKNVLGSEQQPEVSKLVIEKVAAPIFQLALSHPWL